MPEKIEVPGGRIVECMKERIQWVDCTRGIAIILVILGHCLKAANSDAEFIGRAIIFSFHMPLFFILSGMTTRYSENFGEFIRKVFRSAIKLLLPAVILYFIITLIDFINSYGTVDLREYFMMRLRILYYASGVRVKAKAGYIPALGMLWFLFSLFSGRILVDGIQLVLKNKQLITATVAALTVAGVVLGNRKWLPGSFDITLAVLCFLWFGNCIKSVHFQKHLYPFVVVTAAIWGGTLMVSLFVRGTYLELAARKFPLFPLCYITAVAGSLFVIGIGIILDTHKILSDPFAWLGRNSMRIYCVHAMDYLLSKFWNISDNGFLNGIVRILLDVAVSEFIVYVLKKKVFIIWKRQAL